MHIITEKSHEKQIPKPKKEDTPIKATGEDSLFYRCCALAEKGLGDRKLFMDDLYERLNRFPIAGSDPHFILILLNYFFTHTESFDDDDIAKIEAKTIENIQTKNPNLFHSIFRTRELLGYFPEKSCQNIRKAISDMRENAISEAETSEQFSTTTK